MSRKLWMLSVLFLSSQYGMATTISRVASPVSMVLEDNANSISLQLPGQIISYCAQSDFIGWANSNLVGKSVVFHNDQVYIVIGNQSILLKELLVRNGYLYDTRVGDALEVAVAERRGEWACSAKDAIFQLVLKNTQEAKVIATLAMNESKFKGYPWPWTVNVQGKGMYFENREQAYRQIMTSLAAGITSIDIGITQINWKYHSHQFKSPWDALQPSKNIQVSNKIVTTLYSKFGTWSKAIKCYHNCTDPVKGMQYLDNFAKHYDELANLKR